MATPDNPEKPAKPERPVLKRKRVPRYPPRSARSAVTTGRKQFLAGDGSSPWGRRWRDLVSMHIADMGGEDMLSQAQISLAQRAACLEVECEKFEGQLSEGTEIDLDMCMRCANALRRILDIALRASAHGLS